MFSQASVILSTWGACMAGGMRGRGCMVGAYVAGGMHGRGMHGIGACVAGGMHGRGSCGGGGRGHAWQGACKVGWYAWQGHAWQGECMAGGGVHGRRDGHCSGRYASSWNVFLYVYKSKTLVKYPGVLIRGHQHQHEPIILANFPENCVGVK